MTALLERPAAAPAPSRGRSSGWRPALRVARRELSRARGRTAVVLLMVLLPVTGVVALDTLLRTGEISVVEGLPDDLGTAQARLDPGFGVLRQSPDGSRIEGAGGEAPRPLAERELRSVLPAGTTLLAVREGLQERAVRTATGRVVRARLLGVDLRDEGSRGPFQIRLGRAPASPDEVAVTPDLERAGFGPGSTLRLADGERTVTGTVDLPRFYGDQRTVVGSAAGLGLADAPATRYYASGPPVLWEDVLEANALGAVVVSRAVVLDPPDDAAVPRLESYDEQAATTAAIIGLIVVMAVLEVVLLAGPAFAIGARRQRRSLALLAAVGGEPRHVRRVVLAQGVLVGAAAVVLGLPLGVLLAALARAPLARYADATWGPFEVSARDIVLLGLLGAATAVLAALVPALVAGRQPVVASLNGRRSSPVPALAPTAVGLVLLAVGVLMCLASLDQSFPELWVAFSALPTVLGAVLLAPALLALLGRAAGRLPLPLRYAVRDADRQRARTAPAVAAIAATVAAVVALGTSASSDEAERRADYAPSGPPGVAVVSDQSGQADADWAALERAARDALPDEPVTVLRGIALPVPAASEPFETLQVCRPSAPAAVYCDGAATAYGGAVGSSLLVGTQALDAFAPVLEPASLARARTVVRSGGVAVAGPLEGALAGQVELRRQRVTAGADGAETAEPVSSATARAAELVSTAAYPPVLAIVSERVAAQLGGVSTVGLLVGDGLTAAQEDDLRDAVLLADTGLSVSVERGYDDSGRLVVLVLGLVAGALVLAGTLAATSLALVEARPDFTTLGQVGARPGTRRRVAAAYALVLAAAGSALGIAAGLVPGVAAAVAVTRYGSSSNGTTPEPSLLSGVVVPWPLLLGLLGVLPLLVAGIAAATQRGGAVRPVRRPA